MLSAPGPFLTLGNTIPVVFFLSLKKPEGMQMSKTDIIIRIILGDYFI